MFRAKPDQRGGNCILPGVGVAYPVGNLTTFKKVVKFGSYNSNRSPDGIMNTLIVFEGRMARMGLQPMSTFTELVLFLVPYALR